ncbi:hypothetical protein [Inquilinus limosus]|uniref:Uncharacterized protein n=1 Tax=Inquilinus limosus MP06 TaxID=1398085 RepID=A0A0A0DDN8_9PROT|nr:hypothetical protein [Inquilinus limosus]KGM36160.1 hypothetical protein P409_00500 [Inquilinus limosus MP06]
MFKHTPEQARAAWVAALRSGQYKQTTDTLKDDYGFCCLGVACDVYAKLEPETGASWDGDTFVTPNHDDDQNDATLPTLVRNWLGLDGFSGPLTREATLATCAASLANLNDDKGFTFAQLADVIENKGVVLRG